MTIQVWFDFASTYSYPAVMRIEQASKEHGLAIDWRPFLLGPIFSDQGWADSPFNIYPAKGRYMWRDLERECVRLGLALKRPSQFPRNGVAAARVACAGLGEPWLPDFVRAVFHANFVDDREISDVTVLRDILDDLGQPGTAVVERSVLPETRARLRAHTEDAKVRGIFGAPTFVVDGEMFWGSDRLDRAVEWAATACATAAER